ncbi:MAG: HAD hydrolase-like protein [Leadbetterella sp.]|nr:HAD hydrolase-like protein [Leadbetterella sp.]
MRLKNLRDLEARLWVFDCDGVIYDNANGAEKEVVRMMVKFISSRYGCSTDEAMSVRQELLEKHAVSHSITALVREGFDERDILRETYFAIDFQKLGIIPSSRLQVLFSSLPGKKVILTNNHGAYAQKVLRWLDISEHFSAIYGIGELGLIQKPDSEVFQFVENATGINENIVFVDDEIHNVVAAAQFGWTAVWKGYGAEFDGIWLTELK